MVVRLVVVVGVVVDAVVVDLVDVLLVVVSGPKNPNLTWSICHSLDTWRPGTGVYVGLLRSTGAAPTTTKTRWRTENREHSHNDLILTTPYFRIP